MIAILYERRPLRKREMNSISNSAQSFNRHQVHYTLSNKIAFLFNSKSKVITLEARFWPKGWVEV